MTDVRSQVVEWARWGVAHHGEFSYTENVDPGAGPTRQMVLGLAPGDLPVWTDCSGFVTLCYRWARASDPNGLGYARLGYTGTLLATGKEIALSDVLPGDLIVYGPGTGEHVALVVEPGTDPLTVSHGQQGDPSCVHVSQDGREPQRYLRFDTTTGMLMLALDSADRVNAAADIAAGYRAHGRYLTGTYAMAASEASDATAHGLALWSIYEMSALAPLLGAPRGIADADAAVSAARALGQPAGSAIYAAVDFDAQQSEMVVVLAYLRAFAAVVRDAHYLAGAYGGALVVEQSAGIVDMRMQAAGWSGGVVVPGCELYQQITQVTVAGAPRDVDLGAGWFGGWNLDGPMEVRMHKDVAVPIQGPTDPIPGSGEAPIPGLTAAQVDSVTPMVGVGPALPKGGSGFVAQPDGTAHATAWGWAPGSIVNVRVAYSPAA